MPAFELGDDPLDRALDAERLAAAHALERLFLLEHARGGGRGAEVEPRHQADHLFRAGRPAQPALNAGILGEAQDRPLRVARQRTGRAGGYAGKAQRAALDIDLDRPERRAWG